MPENITEVKKLINIFYGYIQALSVLSFEVREEGRLVTLGPNEDDKTTTLRRYPALKV